MADCILLPHRNDPPAVGFLEIEDEVPFFGFVFGNRNRQRFLAQGRGGATGGFPGGMGQKAVVSKPAVCKGAQFGGQTGGMVPRRVALAPTRPRVLVTPVALEPWLQQRSDLIELRFQRLRSTSSGLGSSAMGGSATGGAGLSSQMGGLGGGQATFGNFSPFGNAAMGSMGMGGMNAMGMGMNRGMGMMGGMEWA